MDKNRLDDPHVKANLLFQAHFSQLEMPISDYVTDLKSVLDQSIRIIQAMIDICANSGWLSSTLNCMHLMQMVMQGLWFDKGSALQMLPCLNNNVIGTLVRQGISNVQELWDVPRATLQNLLGSFPASIYQDLQRFPRIHVKLRVKNNNERAGSSCSLNVRLENINAKRKTPRAFAPRFPKVKDEAWWLVLGNTVSSELYALKRVSFAGHLVTHIDLPSDSVLSQGLKLILVSDCYLGYELEYSLEELLKDQPRGV